MSERVGFGRRLAAGLFDGMIAIVVGIPGGMVALDSLLARPAHTTGGEDWGALGEYGRGMTVLLFGPVVGIGFVGLLLMACQGLTGRTPGKRLLKIPSSRRH